MMKNALVRALMALVLSVSILSGCNNRNLSSGNPISKEDLETFCEMRTRVFPDEFSSYTSCLLSMEQLPPISELHPALHEMIECAFAAAEQGDEEAFYACYNFGHPQESCTELGTTRCEGDEQVTCRDDGELWYWDCAAFGDQCMYDQQADYHICALPCPVGRTDGESWCDGQWETECDGGLLRRIDCTYMGGACVEGEYGATCVSSTTTCDPDTYVPQCDGYVFVQCDWSGYILEEDCRNNIFLTSCGTWNQQMIGCVAEPTSCTESHCDGDVANICVMGELFVYDCTQFDLVCVPDGMFVTCGDLAVD